MTGTQHRRRVGTVRPSHLMFTGGVGALIDLPNFPVLVRGLDDWRYDTVPDWTPLSEPRLLAAVGKLLSAPVAELRPPPWMDGFDAEPNGQACRVGVPVMPFPQWLRCTACNRLAPLDSGNWGFVNDKARRPDEAKFFHQDCPRRRRQPLAVAARFVLACVNGHLDDFPYREFVHRGGACPEASHPPLLMDDYGGNRGANVMIRCPSCTAKRNISQATGSAASEPAHLPRPSSAPRHVHRMPGAADRDRRRRVQHVVRADPVHARRAADRRQRAADQGRAAVEQLQNVQDRAVLDFAWHLPAFQVLHQWSKDEVFDAIDQHRKTLESGPGGDQPEYPDLLTPEWEIFTAAVPPEPTDDFTLRRRRRAGRAGRVPLRRRAGRTAPRGPRADRVHPAGRARPGGPRPGEARAAGPGQPDLGAGQRGPRRGHLPAHRPALMATWEARVRDSDVVREHREAFGRFRTNRYSDRIRPTSTRCTAGPGRGTSRCTPCPTC